MSAPGLIIAAPASGSGKTILTLALLRALRRAGIPVASFKVGPDYIDPMFHARASGRPCINLDSWAMRIETLAGLSDNLSREAALVMGEGVMGLFDGAADGRGSTADLASLFDLPVILVVDARGMAASAAALVEGFTRHRDDVEVAGIIFNRVGSEAHAALLRRACDDRFAQPARTTAAPARPAHRGRAGPRLRVCLSRRAGRLARGRRRAQLLLTARGRAAGSECQCGVSAGRLSRVAPRTPGGQSRTLERSARGSGPGRLHLWGVRRVHGARPMPDRSARPKARHGWPPAGRDQLRGAAPASRLPAHPAAGAVTAGPRRDHLPRPRVPLRKPARGGERTAPVRRQRCARPTTRSKRRSGWHGSRLVSPPDRPRDRTGRRCRPSGPLARGRFISGLPGAVTADCSGWSAARQATPRASCGAAPRGGVATSATASAAPACLRAPPAPGGRDRGAHGNRRSPPPPDDRQRWHSGSTRLD